MNRQGEEGRTQERSESSSGTAAPVERTLCLAGLHATSDAALRRVNSQLQPETWYQGVSMPLGRGDRAL